MHERSKMIQTPWPIGYSFNPDESKKVETT